VRSSVITMRSDFELLDAWRDGDRAAGNELFDRHFDAVYRFFRNKITEGAEDLVQQTFLACVQTRDTFRGDASFRTYLFTAARSKLYTYLDKRHREGQNLDWGVTSCEDLGISPTGIIAKNEIQRVLLAALRRLPLDMQIALELYYFEQIRGPQLAEVLGVPEGTVRSRLRRGREILRDHVTALTRDPSQVESTMTDLEAWAKGLRDSFTPRNR
jgi:RNA polymerase sigma factor (sigma-70 family)